MDCPSLLGSGKPPGLGDAICMATRTPSKAPAEYEVLNALLRQASDDEDSKVAFQAYYHQGGRLKPTDLLDML
eukprot:5404333-Prymnesium_polylepis.1